MSILILIHGMGQSTAESFKKEVIDASRKVCNLYPSLKGKSFEDFTEIKSIGYNEIFDEYREKIASDSANILQYLKEVDFSSDDIDTVKSMMEINNELGEDGFLQTHWLDVLLYRFTSLGEAVRIKVASEIVSTMYESIDDVNIIAHSLGTAVCADTLARLFTVDGIGDESLDITEHGINSLHMIANTSRVLQESNYKVNETVVKPGQGGCLTYYNDYYHIFDPFTLVKPFRPADNHTWIGIDSWYRYNLKRLTRVTNKHGNVHSIEHYLMNPEVHLNIFEQVLDIELGFDITENAIKKASNKYDDMTQVAIAKELEEQFDLLKEGNLNGIEGLFKAVKKVNTFIAELKKQNGI